MTFLLLTFFALALTQARADSTFYEDNDSNVITLDSSNFDELVLESNDIWMVEFYAPWLVYF